MNLNADATAADACLVIELGDHILYRRGGDRKCDADTAARWRIDRSVHADDFALHIEGGTPRMSLVDRRIDLNEIVVWTASDVTTAGRYNARCYGATEAKGI